MNANRVVHDTFVTNIVSKAPPSQVFAAYADIRALATWLPQANAANER